MSLPADFVEHHLKGPHRLAYFMDTAERDLTRDELLAIIGYMGAEIKEMREQHSRDLDMLCISVRRR